MIKIQDLPNYYKTNQNAIVLNDQTLYDDHMTTHNANLAREIKISDLENSVIILTESVEKLTKLLNL